MCCILANIFDFSVLMRKLKLYICIMYVNQYFNKLTRTLTFTKAIAWKEKLHTKEYIYPTKGVVASFFVRSKNDNRIDFWFYNVHIVYCLHTSAIGLKNFWICMSVWLCFVVYATYVSSKICMTGGSKNLTIILIPYSRTIQSNFDFIQMCEPIINWRLVYGKRLKWTIY